MVVRPWRRPQEKGIDLLIGLDVVEFVLTGRCDVAVIVSLDRDLHEIPQAIQKLKRLIDRPVRLEAAVPVSAAEAHPKRLRHFSSTHQIGPDVFAMIRDDTDYTVPDHWWRLPQFPPSLGSP